MKKKLFFLILVVLPLFNDQVYGQEKSVTFKGTNILSFQLFGPEMVGAYYNRYVSEKVSLNAGFGWGLSGHLGVNYYLTHTKPVNFYIGSQACLLTEVDFDNFSKTYGSQPALYFPAGLQLITGGFTIQLEGGYNIYKDDYGQRNTQPFLFVFRIGGAWK